ncbi:MAG: hypothetical protein R2939_04535 [Kofleriaceae bacterium]
MPPRRFVVLLALALLAAIAPRARAESIDGHVGHRAGVRRVGAQLDVGVPDGATAALVVRPARPLRLHVGASHNLVSTGVRVGATWVPLSAWVSPTVSVSYGHLPEGDATPLARMIAGDPALSSSALERVGYDHASAHVGLEFGRARATFYLHAGVTRVTGSLRGLGTAFGDDAMVTFEEDPRYQLWTVAARVGLIVYAR